MHDKIEETDDEDSINESISAKELKMKTVFIIDLTYLRGSEAEVNVLGIKKILDDYHDQWK